MNEIVEAFI